MSLLSDLLKSWLINRPGRSLAGDAEGGAQWISKALRRSGYKADFSLGSLRELDRFFDEQAVDGGARPDGLLAQQLGQRLFCLGAYCGEVIRRHVGGAWLPEAADSAQPEIDLTLKLPDGSLLWPVQRVMKRFQLGSEESLYTYAITCAGSSTGERS